MTRRKASFRGSLRPLDRRPCDSCGESIFFAFSPVSESWRALTAEPVTDDRRAFALVVVNTQAWRRVDLLEHYLITRQVNEEKARELIDTYPHHLLHVHDREDS
jgi:hypothetical protein